MMDPKYLEANKTRIKNENAQANGANNDENLRSRRNRKRDQSLKRTTQ